MQNHDGLITREIKTTIWQWAIAHGQTKDCVFFCQPHDDAAYPLRYALPAFGLFPDAAPVRQRLETLQLGWQLGPHDTRIPLITGHALLALLPYSPTPAARRILAWRQAGHLVGDIPSGVQRLREHACSLLTAIERQEALEFDEECAVNTGFVLYRPSAQTLVLTALHLDPGDPAIAPLLQQVTDEAGFGETMIWGLALHSPLPEACAFHSWFHAEFLPALRRHSWYDPAHGHAIPIGQVRRCAEFQREWQVQLSGTEPIDVGILRDYEGTASYPDAGEEKSAYEAR